MIALTFKRDAEIIEMLLDKSANARDVGSFGKSPLIVALGNNRYSKPLIKRLLDAGALHTDRDYDSILHDFIGVSLSQGGLREDIFQLLVEAGARVSTLNANGQFLICQALALEAQPKAIKRLVRQGVPLNNCVKHPSPFHCLIGDNFGRELKANMVKT